MSAQVGHDQSQSRHQWGAGGERLREAAEGPEGRPREVAGDADRPRGAGERSRGESGFVLSLGWVDIENEKDVWMEDDKIGSEITGRR